MHQEIEVKFLDVNHQEIRDRLKELKAELGVPMRVMRRAILDFPKRTLAQKNDGWVRVRDEGDHVTMTYKQLTEQQRGYSKEVEVTVSDYEKAIELLEQIGLKIFAVQESRRETWKLGNVEIVLDEWPWVKPYIEIDGSSEASIRDVSARLGFAWSQAIYGSLDMVYASQYPGIRLPNEHISQIPEMIFGQPLPKWLKDRIEP
jgi:adenylate cyclase class 2